MRRINAHSRLLCFAFRYRFTRYHWKYPCSLTSSTRHISFIDLKSLPVAVRKIIGFALDQAQRGGKHLDAQPLILNSAVAGLKMAHLLEITLSF
jgi:hypothetical protein